MLPVMFFSCTKMQEVTPVNNELFGVWVNDKGSMQFTINNTSGIGEVAKFTDFHKHGERFLRVEMPGINEEYKISYVHYSEMKLISSNSTELLFSKIVK